jgi:hypothetical protein
VITCNLGKQEKASWYPRAHAARTADSLSCIEAFRMFSVASHMHGACRLPSSEGGTVDEDANDTFEVILLFSILQFKGLGEGGSSVSL